MSSGAGSASSTADPLGGKVGPGALVGVAYALHDADGELIEKTPPDEPVIYVHGYGQLLPVLEAVLEGMSEGQERSTWVDEHDAFGSHDPSAVFEIGRDEFPEPEQVQVGDEFSVEGEQGEFSLRVIDVLPDGFLVDANHPLAGQRVRVTARVEHVRPASADEIGEAERVLEAVRAAGQGPGVFFGGGGEPEGVVAAGGTGVRSGGLLSADSLLRRRGGEGDGA
ncbi:MAG: FKBP-type peptidyl-prolyl cis-trans isomerase [Polyangiaceae bacterium]|jgi:FKBP-type peptidyl-prolyl cis-trans isomerase SlyD|nr:FKBP-type peptidyl-prolyl cis-trans isomerase [Polyangiaceae bacterium]